MNTPIKIFICYAREDRASLELLRKKLNPVEQSKGFELWYDKKITGGQEWDAEIRFNLQAAPSRWAVKKEKKTKNLLTR